MIKKFATKKYFIGWLTFVLVMLLATNFVFAQCGGYFKLNNRAVNKTWTISNHNFKMDDWNGDGKADFWNYKLNPNGSTRDILIYPSKPTGYWDWDNPIVLTTSSTTSEFIGFPLVVKDFNSDGKTDIFDGTRIHKNVNNQTLVQLEPVFFGFIAGEDFKVVDVNGDGLLDWINSVNFAGQTSVGYYPGTADGVFGARVNITTGEGANALVVGDFNGDGKTDIVYSNINGYRILLNTGGGVFTVGSLTNDSHWHFFRKVADFNNDGRADILGHESSLSRLFVSYGQANGTFSEQEISVIVQAPVENKYHIAELNGDSRPDIIVVYQNNYSVFSNNLAGNFPRTDYQRSLATTGSNLLFEDFSGDNKADIYDNDFAYNPYALNTFGEQVITVKENVCQPFGETKRANFESNYEGDLVFWNATTRDWASMNLSYFFNSAHIHTVYGLTGDVPAPGDFDADGKTDYAVFRPNTGDWYIRRSSDIVTVTLHFGLNGDIAVPNDYDGGGKTDIAVFRPSDGNWYIFSTETQQISILHFGLNGDRPVPADYDGDGKTDIAVFRPSDGNWYYYRSSDQSIAIIHWGIETDKPLPADYDGDGKADLAVYRDGDWYILRSGNFSFNFIHFGTATDIPMPMQQDGYSGSAELVVFRPSNGHWYNYRTPNLPRVFNQSGSVPVYFGLPNN